MSIPSNRRSIGPFQIPAGNFGPDTNPFATPDMPGVITPEAAPAPVNPRSQYDPRTDSPFWQRMGGYRGPRGMSQYKSGTPYVPQTGPAILHQGEAVIPADQNPVNTLASPVSSSFLSRFLSNLGTGLSSAAQAGNFVQGLGDSLGAIQQQNKQNQILQSQLVQQTLENNFKQQQIDIQQQHLQLQREMMKPPKPDFGAQVQERLAQADKLGLAGEDRIRFGLTGQMAAEKTPPVTNRELDDYLADSTIDRGIKKNAATFAAWKARLAPVAQFNLQNQGTTGPSADVAKRFGYTPQAFDAAAEKYFQTGQLPPAGRGGPALAGNKAIQNRASELHPGESLALGSAAYNANKASLAKAQTQFDSVNAFENTAIKNLDQVAIAGKAIPDLGSRYANVPVRKLLNDPAMARFRTALLTAQTESAKILSSANASGVLSDDARHEAQQILDGNLTFPAMLASINQLKTDFGNRHDSYAQQIEDIKKRMGGKPAQSSGQPQATHRYNPVTGNIEKIGD